METTIRRDGKRARRSLGGVPVGSPPPPSAPVPGLAPSWHELVQPGPKGDPTATMSKRMEYGQYVTHHPYRIEPLPGNANYAPRDEIRELMKARGAFRNPVVLHRTRSKPLVGAEREAHRAPVTVFHEMTGGNTVRRDFNDGTKAAERRARNRATRRVHGRRRLTGLHPTSVIVDESITMLEVIENRGGRR